MRSVTTFKLFVQKYHVANMLAILTTLYDIFIHDMFTVAFLLFLDPVRVSKPAGQSLTLY